MFIIATCIFYFMHEIQKKPQIKFERQRHITARVGKQILWKDVPM